MTSRPEMGLIVLRDSDLERDLSRPQAVQPRLGIVRMGLLGLFVVVGAAVGALGIGWYQDYPADRGFAIGLMVIGLIVWWVAVVLVARRTLRHVRAVSRRRADLRAAYAAAAPTEMARRSSREELSRALSSARSDSASAIASSQFPGLLPSVLTAAFLCFVALLAAVGVDSADRSLQAMSAGLLPLLAVSFAVTWNRVASAYVLQQLALCREKALSSIARGRFPDESIGGPARALRLLRDPRMIAVGMGVVVLVILLLV